MHYLIYGTGAVGGYLGGLLNLSGIKATFLARPRIANALNKSGLHIHGQGIQDHIPKPHVCISAEEALTQQAPDVILLTVKAYDVETVAGQLLQFAPHPFPIVCFTNGVGSEETLSTLLPQYDIIPATTTTATQMRESGVITIERKRGVGLGGRHPLLATIHQDFGKAGMLVRRFQDPKRMKWSKLLTNIVSNATSAIIGWPSNRIFNHPDLYRLEVEALREAVHVMRGLKIKPLNLPKVPVSLLSMGIFFPPRITQNLLGSIVTRGRGTKRPSFHYDIGRGRSEVGWLNGAVVREGKPIGLSTPANRVLTDTMMDIVLDSSLHEQYRNRPEKLLQRASEAGVPGIRGYNA